LTSRAGVRRITIHDTRRTCGSLLAALDVHPRVAMAILRHSRIALTMEIYTQVPDKTTRDTLRRLSDWLGQADEPGPRGAGEDQGTAREVSPARKRVASRALLLCFAAVRDDKRPIPYSESAFGVGALGGTRTPNLLTLLCLSRAHRRIHRPGEVPAVRRVT
jgi:hypothetical protein